MYRSLLLPRSLLLATSWAMNHSLLIFTVPKQVLFQLQIRNKMLKCLKCKYFLILGLSCALVSFFHSSICQKQRYFNVKGQDNGSSTMQTLAFNIPKHNTSAIEKFRLLRKYYFTKGIKWFGYKLKIENIDCLNVIGSNAWVCLFTVQF